MIRQNGLPGTLFRASCAKPFNTKTCTLTCTVFLRRMNYKTNTVRIGRRQPVQVAKASTALNRNREQYVESQACNHCPVGRRNPQLCFVCRAKASTPCHSTQDTTWLLTLCESLDGTQRSLGGEPGCMGKRTRVSKCLVCPALVSSLAAQHHASPRSNTSASMCIHKTAVNDRSTTERNKPAAEEGY